MSGATAPSGNLEAKRRPGRKGNFAGKRLELLESFVPKWEKARSNRTTGDFWATVNAAYWKTFHWRLEPTEEPSSEASVDEDLSEEDLKAKAAKITLVESVSFLSFHFFFRKLKFTFSKFGVITTINVTRRG